MTKRLILGVFLAVALIAGVGGAAFGAYTLWNEAEAEGDTQAWAEVLRYRWENVTIEVPAGGGIGVVRWWDAPGMYSSPGEGLAAYIPVIQLEIKVGNEASVLMIDANTGEVAYEDVRPQHRASFDAILDTLRLEGSEATDAAWPYTATPPQGPRYPWGNITFLRPDPASGIVVSFGASDGIGRPGKAFVEIRNGRSRRVIDADTGQVFVDSQGQAHDSVDERDREAFDRFTSTIEPRTR